MSHTKTFDCEGCRPYCYGGYHMREDADGDGDYVLAEDFNRVKKQLDELLAALNDAATSLETIAIRSYGESSCLDSKQQMRGFAGSRAVVARKDIARAKELK